MTPGKKLLNALAGIAPHAPARHEHMFAFENVSTRNFDPPAYIVAFLFLNLLGYQDFGRSEKVWWHTFFKYRDHVFLLRDYKFGSWSLETRKGVPVDPEIVRQVIAKIQSAARHADEVLALELKKRINDEKFWLHNGYSGLRAAYDFYTSEVKESRVILQNTIECHAKANFAIDKLTDRLNERARLEAVVAHRTFPLLVSFFSLLEFIFDAFYAFERPAMSFLEFRKLSWQERLKAVVPLPPGSEVLKKYERLGRIKSLFRNPLTHGLTNETSLLVPVPFGGLVPVSYEHFESSVHFGVATISDATALEAIEVFDGMLSYFASTPPFAYYILYIEHGFSIPMAQGEIASIRAEMSSIEAFEEYLEEKSHFQDAVTNRDI